MQTHIFEVTALASLDSEAKAAFKVIFFDTGPEGQELEGLQVEIKSQSLVLTEARTQMGSRTRSGMGDSSSGAPEGLRYSPLLSAGRKPSLELHTQNTEERATLDRYHRFHGQSGMCA